MTEGFVRPPTPVGFDPSRAALRAADPRGWAYSDTRLQAVYDVISERRDIRRFRPEAVGDEVLERVLGAAHLAPSVGYMQPWRLILIRSVETRQAVRQLVQRERMRQAPKFGERAQLFLDQKVEGIVEAPLGICVCCDHGDPGVEVLGRGTIPETDLQSTACAIENLWLAARAEGLGVGWVSFYRPADLAALLGLPERVEAVAYLCVGWPDEHPVRPTLETVGWASRKPLSEIVMAERWQGEGGDPVAGVEADTLHREAAITVRDRSDELIKPPGSLGALEGLTERWALVSGGPPSAKLKAGVLLAAADHGHLVHGTSAYSQAVSGQMVAAAARGESAAAVLARRGEHRLLIADLGLAGTTPPGVRDRKVAAATADFTVGPAMGDTQLEQALAAGRSLVEELVGEEPIDCLVLGEIGIGNTTTAAALACLMLGIEPMQAVGRGAGVDAAGIERKRAVVARAVELHGYKSGLEAMVAVGGFELAALTGAVGAAALAGLPVILDGYATGVAALAAVQHDPTVAEFLFAGHASAEPGHRAVLDELGLEPLLDLRMRLGEGSGALLALGLIEQAGLLHAQMGTFEESGVSNAQ